MNTNDDQNLKKLTERLVAMSPEPPPFPEEVTMTTPSKSPTRNPLLVFAGAAAAVLIAIGVPFLFLSGDDPLAGPDTSTTTSTPLETTTTLPESTTTTSAPVELAEYGTVVYLPHTPENAFLGNPALVAFETFVSAPPGASDEVLVRETLRMLTDPSLVLPAPAYFNGIPEGVEVIDVRLADGADNALIIEMNEKFLEGGGGLLADFTMLNQLIYTATMRPDFTEVQFIVNNEQVTEFGSEGLDLSSSVNRETFQEHLNLIYLTSPILPNQDGNVVVQGISNTYEASMSLRVIDSEGEIIHEEWTTATCGSGCWGDYLFVLDSDLFGPETFVQVFEYSAEDGDPEEVVTVPYNEGQPWVFLP